MIYLKEIEPVKETQTSQQRINKMHRNFGFNDWDNHIVTTSFICPCGESSIDRVKDHTPGFKENYIMNHCDKCRKDYDIDFSNDGGLSAKLKD